MACAGVPSPLDIDFAASVRTAMLTRRAILTTALLLTRRASAQEQRPDPATLDRRPRAARTVRRPRVAGPVCSEAGGGTAAMGRGAEVDRRSDHRLSARAASLSWNVVTARGRSPPEQD